MLKTPMHLGYVDVIAELMPDAMFVQTHRDPIMTIPSFSSLVHGLWAGGSDSADAYEAGHQWCATFEEHLNKCLEDRRSMPRERFIDVDFRDTVSRPLEVVERIYRRIGLPMTERRAQAHRSYMQQPPARGAAENTNTRSSSSALRRPSSSAVSRRYRERHILPFVRPNRRGRTDVAAKTRSLIISGIGPGLGIKLAVEAAREGSRGIVIGARTAARLDEAEGRSRARSMTAARSSRS